VYRVDVGKIAGGVVLFVILSILVRQTVTADTTRPAVKGKTVTVELKKPVTIGGLSISLARANHKHADGGTALGMWTFSVKKGATAKDVEMRSSTEHFQAEVSVHGVLLVFQNVSYEKFTVTLAAAKAPKPLTDDACAALITAAAEKAEIEQGAARGWSNEEGIVVMTAEGWRGYCGTLTKRVWLENPMAVDDKK
jgi:hypothetical protein